MTPRHPAARLFAAQVLATATKPAARNLAAAYLALSAEVTALRKERTGRLKAHSQRVRRARERAARERAKRQARAIAEAGGHGTKGALRELRRINAERLRGVLAKVDGVIVELDERERESA